MLMMHLLDLVFKSVLLISHGVSLLLEESPELFVKLSQALCLFGIFLDLSILSERVFADFTDVLVGFLLNALQVADPFIESIDVSLSLLLLALHLCDFFLKFLVL